MGIEHMTKEMKANRYDGLLTWVFRHTEDKEDYVRALKNIGFSKDEVIYEIRSNMLAERTDEFFELMDIYDEEGGDADDN